MKREVYLINLTAGIPNIRNVFITISYLAFFMACDPINRTTTVIFNETEMPLTIQYNSEFSEREGEISVEAMSSSRKIVNNRHTGRIPPVIVDGIDAGFIIFEDGKQLMYREDKKYLEENHVYNYYITQDHYDKAE